MHNSYYIAKLLYKLFKLIYFNILNMFNYLITLQLNKYPYWKTIQKLNLLLTNIPNTVLFFITIINLLYNVKHEISLYDIFVFNILYCYLLQQIIKLFI